MSRRKGNAQSSKEKLATRSDYERGKLDGLVEAQDLIREQANELRERLETLNRPATPEEEEYLRGWDKASKHLWVIYKRRVI